MNESIIDCEIAFKKCFAEWIECERIVRFRDPKLRDMYVHNTALIKTAGIEVPAIRDCILKELKQSKKDGLTFSLSICDRFLEKSDLAGLLPGEPEITHMGFYVLDFDRIEKWKINSDCRTEIANSRQSVKDILELELSEYGDMHGEDFCSRKIDRLGEIFLSDESLNACLAYYKNETAGRCEIFLYKNTAKIEDFDVKKSLQRRCIGTTLLKAAALEAKKHGAEEIYLVTDENDTAKEMYKKLGWKRIGVFTEIFWDKL